MSGRAPVARCLRGTFVALVFAVAGCASLAPVTGPYLRAKAAAGVRPGDTDLGALLRELTC